MNYPPTAKADGWASSSAEFISCFFGSYLYNLIDLIINELRGFKENSETYICNIYRKYSIFTYKLKRKLKNLSK